MKKITQLAMTAIMLLSSAFSVSAYDFAAGDGSSSNPYQVASRADLEGIKDFITSGDAGATSRGKYFIQISDIDMSEGLWTPIGTSSSAPFCGNYNGNGYKISDIAMDRTPGTSSTTVTYNGLFGCIGAGAVIENVVLDGGIISVTNDAEHLGGSYVGSIAGYIYNITSGNTIIRNCSSTATIVNNSLATVYCGGIAGYVRCGTTGVDGSEILISNCYYNGTITATESTTTSSTSFSVSGIAAFPYVYTSASGPLTIEKCFAAGDIYTGSANTSARVGGISGRVYENTTAGANPLNIRNNVAAQENIESAGTAHRVYASHNSGGIIDVADNYGYADMLVKGATETSDDATSSRGLDKTLAELQTQATYEALGWDFTNIWQMEAGDFPTLRDPKGNSGIPVIVADNDVIVAKRYYNLQGMEITPETTGIRIVKNIHASGRISASKELILKK